MTGLFIDITEYIPNAEVEAVERALKYLPRPEEDYIEIASKSNVDGWDEPYAWLQGICKGRALG